MTSHPTDEYEVTAAYQSDLSPANCVETCDSQSMPYAGLLVCNTSMNITVVPDYNIDNMGKLLMHYNPWIYSGW